MVISTDIQFITNFQKSTFSETNGAILLFFRPATAYLESWSDIEIVVSVSKALSL